MKKISIRIEKPCHEDWEAMTPIEQGKFCSACQKNVTDFSKMTDNEILEFLANHTGPMCGQLRESQLNRMIVQTRLTGTNWKLNSFMTTLLVASGAVLNAQSPSAPNNQTVIIDEKHPTGPVCIKVPETKVHHVLVAQVVDSASGNPQANARVQIAGTSHYAVTDQKGNFTLEIPDSLATETITLAIQCPGYLSEQFTFVLEKIGNVNKIELALEERYFKGEMIIETPPRKCGNDGRH